MSDRRRSYRPALPTEPPPNNIQPPLPPTTPAVTRYAGRITVLEAEVERLRQLRARELDYSVALQRIIEGTEHREFSDLIPPDLYHLAKAKRTVARAVAAEARVAELETAADELRTLVRDAHRQGYESGTADEHGGYWNEPVAWDTSDARAALAAEKGETT